MLRKKHQQPPDRQRVPRSAIRASAPAPSSGSTGSARASAATIASTSATHTIDAQRLSHGASRSGGSCCHEQSVSAEIVWSGRGRRRAEERLRRRHWDGSTAADPMFQGRVQVTLHFVDCVDLSSLARVASMYAGPMCGHLLRAATGRRGAGRVRARRRQQAVHYRQPMEPAHLPPLPSPLAQTRAIRTLLGNQILFSEAPPSVTIQSEARRRARSPCRPSQHYRDARRHPDRCRGDSDSITTAGVIMTAGGNVLSLTPKGVDIVSAKAVSIKAAALADVTAAGGVNVTSVKEAV